MKRENVCANKVKEKTRSHGYNLAQLHFPCSSSQCVSLLMVLLQQRFTTLQEKTFFPESHLVGKPEPGLCSLSAEM